MAKSIKGIDKLIKKLKKLDDAVENDVEIVLAAVSNDMRNTAIDSLDTVSPGRDYVKPGGRTHRASKPGDAPNTDEGQLKSGLFASKKKKNEYAFGVSGVPYAKSLEYGTRKMAARPFIRPAFNKHKDEIAEEIDKIIKRILKE